MKKFAFCLSLIFISFASYAQKESKTDTLTVNTHIYCDHCLECSSCAGTINMAMANLYGIKKVTILPEKQSIRVVYNPKKMSPEKIREAISSAGYDADNVLAKPEAVASLDGCCKKH